MKLEQAQSIAEELRRELEPGCERIEIAGSIRRKKPEVKDIELCLIPKMLTLPNTGQLAMALESEERQFPAPVDHLRYLQEQRRVLAINAGTDEIVPRPGGVDPDGRYWRL